MLGLRIFTFMCNAQVDYIPWACGQSRRILIWAKILCLKVSKTENIVSESPGCYHKQKTTQSVRHVRIPTLGTDFPVRTPCIANAPVIVKMCIPIPQYGRVVPLPWYTP